MVPIGYLIWQSLRLLGYADPRDAPLALLLVALIVYLVTVRIVFHFAADDAYDDLQKRRLKKKKRGEY